MTQNNTVEQFNEDNIVDLSQYRTKTGGGGPIGYNWLVSLDIGDTFLSRAVNEYQMVDYQEYCILDKLEKSVKLMVNLPNQSVSMWVDPARFSTKFELIEVIPKEE